MLNVSDHSRNSAGLRYVYPVISRRAQGVSVGINLNVNNACNWACIYCQVPNLTRGGPPPVDLALLEQELRSFLHEATMGSFMVETVPLDARRLMDIAFSGNGEPTSAETFPSAVGIVSKVLTELQLTGTLKIRLITNGSLLHRHEVQLGIRRIGEENGEVWFKVDRVTVEGIRQINGVNLTPSVMHENLERCTALAPTWLQTCFFAMDGEAPDTRERDAYLDFLAAFKGKIQGVHLYGLARPSMQPESFRLHATEPEIMQSFADAITALGVEVRLST
jgi:wyosine [tRNA(Phe)-imidazoG37] synthetase (radical SAM superfamily)